MNPKWGADFFAEAFQKYVPYNVIVEYSLENINDYDLIWVHNVANLLKGKEETHLIYTWC
jgi:hypothetical protein